jgi:hypothetical protein
MNLNPKRQVFLIFISSVLALFSLVSILNFSDPNSSSLSVFISFYLSLFIFTLSTITLVGLFFRNKFLPNLYIINLKISFRQALLIAILITCSFILLSFNLLFWWVELSIILFLLTIEVFLSMKL